MNIQVATIMLLGYTFMFVFGYWCALDDMRRRRK
jgi:hypothetical protein